MALEAWICPSCNNKHRVDVVACKNCGEYKPPSVRKVQARGGKFIDKKVNDLVRKATRSSRNKVKSENILLNVTTPKLTSKSRRESLLQKQLQAKSEEILKLARQLEAVRKSVGKTKKEISDIGINELDILSIANACKPDNSQSTTNKGSKDAKKSNRYVCSECGLACGSRNNLREHCVKHFGSFSNCYVEGCDYKAPSRHYLKRHLEKKHDRTKVYHCLRCPETFEKKSGLLEHKKNAHSTTKPSSNDDIDYEISIIESYAEDNGSAADEDDDSVADDKEWVPLDEGESSDNKKQNSVKLKRPKQKTKTRKESSGPREKAPRERIKCPHDGCKYTATSEYFIAQHRIREHKENVALPKKKRSRDKKFTCEVCGKTATSSWYIKRHMRTHTGEKPFACSHPGCEYKAFRKSHLIRHETNMHDPSNKLKCDICSYVAYDKANLQAHKQYSHAEDNYDCVYCVYYAKGKDTLRSHIKRVHKHICELCEWEFLDDNLKAAHIALHTDGGITCSICSTIVVNGTELISHTLSEHQIVIETRIPRKRLILPTCDICSYQFPNKPLLDTHMKQHQDDGIRCSVCEAVFPEMEELKSHTELEHGFGIDAVKKRIRYKGSTTFPCLVCGYEFKTEAEQEAHQSRHRPDGSIICEHCTFIADTMSLMIEHYSDHHNITSTAAPRKRKNHHACSVCKYLFYTEEIMEEHKKHHLEDGSIRCSECDVIFSKMKHLVDHMMLMHNIKLETTYQRVRPYLNTCPVCGYMFESKEKLNEHRAHHRPDGSITCEFCDYHTDDMENLKDHMLSVHKTVLNSNKKRYKRSKGDPPRSPRRRARKNRQEPTITLLSNHNISNILEEESMRYLNEPPDQPDIESYISSCAYESSSLPYRQGSAFDSHVPNHFFTNNIFTSTLQQSPLVSPSLIQQSASGLDIRQKIDLSKLVPGGLESIGLTPHKQYKTTTSKPKVKRARKDGSKSDNNNSQSRLKAFPGLFM